MRKIMDEKLGRFRGIIIDLTSIVVLSSKSA